MQKRSKLKILKHCLSSVALISFSNSVQALESEVKLKGGFDFMAVALESSGTKYQNQVSDNKDNFGLYSGGNIYFDYNLLTDDGLKYGTKLGLEHSFKNNRMTPISVYLESDYGKFEGGSDRSAGKNMRITGYNGACGSSSMWSAFLRSSPDSNKISYIVDFCSFLDSKMRTAGKVEYSRKVSYFTPKFSIGENSKVQLGISYVPDSSNMGTGNVSDAVVHSPVGASNYKFAIKDGVSYGIKAQFNLSEEMLLQSSVVGEVGKPIGYEKGSGSSYNKKSNVSFKKLNNYVVGTELKYNKFSAMASYGNYNQSLTSKEIDKLGTNSFLYALGVKYKFDKIETSATLFQSEYKKNKLGVYSVGIDYNVTKGVKTYASVTYYKTDGRFFNTQNELKLDKSDGKLLILGTKISF